MSGAASTTPSFVREVKTTTIFVGSIAPGITDQTLKDLLSVSISSQFVADT
jgi:hypothetical protein